jgi:hypothetical protein
MIREFCLAPRVGLLACLLLGLPSASIAITIQPPSNNTCTAVPLGRINGLPERYGGLAFKRGDPNTILIGGQANSASGRFYEVPLVRDSASRKITGSARRSRPGSAPTTTAASPTTPAASCCTRATRTTRSAWSRAAATRRTGRSH